MSYQSRDRAVDALPLRAAAETDRGAVTRLLAELRLAPLDEAAQFGPQYVVAYADTGELAGVAGFERYQADALLRSVAVSPVHRARGLGRRLTEDRLAWAAAKGVVAVYLLTTDAAGYWEHFGFERIGRGDAPPAMQASRQWAGGCSASAVAMRRALSPGECGGGGR